MSRRCGRPWIVVFGAGVRSDGRPSDVLRRRIEGAAIAWRRLPEAGIIATGGVGRHGPAEAIVIRDGLVARGVPAAAVLVEPESRDTLESALACAAILRAQPDVGRVRVCTSCFHRWRCMILLRILGFRTGAVRVASPPWPPGARLLLWILKEPVVLPWDMFLALRHRLGRRATGPDPA